MFIDLHLLQNFAPSNLNRDDTGSPKDCEFGGYRRARISSQCLKRAIRNAFREQGLIPADHLAARTKRLLDALTTRLAARGKGEDEARAVIRAALAGVGLTLVGEDEKTQYLLFLGEGEIAAVAEVCLAHWDELAAAAPGAGGAGGRDAKKAGRAAVSPAVKKALEAVLDGGRAADLALFGRMLADLPERNIDAAGQVAHAISTNKVSMEFDFYTAVDDSNPEDTAGADMLGTVEFNSACFYRYASIDLRQLRRNLDDAELVARTVEAFIRASVTAIPTGKQNSMAAQNPPSLVFAVVRRDGRCSLANAFVNPVRPGADGDLVQNSVRELDSYWGRLAAMYGEDGVVERAVCALEPDGLTNLKPARVASVAEVIGRVRTAVAAELGKAGAA